MKRFLIVVFASLFAFYGCKCSNNAPAEASAQQEDTPMAAIERYMTEVGGQYSPGTYCIPYAQVVATDESNPEDIRVWGIFQVENYNLEGDTLLCVSGGSHPGLMHVAKTADSYEVKSFDEVADGSLFDSTAKAIFLEHYDTFIKIQSNDTARKAVREKAIATYVLAHQIPAKLYKDYGWDAVTIPQI